MTHLAFEKNLWSVFVNSLFCQCMGNCIWLGFLTVYSTQCKHSDVCKTKIGTWAEILFFFLCCFPISRHNSQSKWYSWNSTLYNCFIDIWDPNLIFSLTTETWWSCLAAILYECSLWNFKVVPTVQLFANLSYHRIDCTSKGHSLKL